MRSLDRRTFLASPFAATAALKMASGKTPSFKFPTDVRHRLSVSTYPFRDLIISPRKPGAGKLTLPEFAATVVEKFKVFGIEPWSAHFESLEPAYISGLATAFKKANLQVVNIPCDVGAKLCGTPGEREAALATYRQWVDAAVALGSPSIRVHCPLDLQCAVDGLRKLADYGLSKNIVINLENDNPESEDPAHIVKVIENANKPYLRSLPDFCNSMLIHDDQDFNARSLAALFPHAYNISHVKDLEIDKGRRLSVDVNRIFAIAKKAGYRGFFSMESESDQDPYESTKLLIAAAVQNLG